MTVIDEIAAERRRQIERLDRAAAGDGVGE